MSGYSHWKLLQPGKFVNITRSSNKARCHHGPNSQASLFEILRLLPWVDQVTFRLATGARVKKFPKFRPCVAGQSLVWPKQSWRLQKGSIAYKTWPEIPAILGHCLLYPSVLDPWSGTHHFYSRGHNQNHHVRTFFHFFFQSLFYLWPCAQLPKRIRDISRVFKEMW